MKITTFFFLNCILFWSSLFGKAGDSYGTTNEWQANVYPNIGLEIKCPKWSMDVQDQARRWSLLACPLVQNPVADAQYRVMISIVKLPQNEHMRIYPKETNPTDWAISQHLTTSQMTNNFWIYSRRDIFGNGFGYYCSGRIKRISNAEFSAAQQFGGDEGKLAEESRRILDSIAVLQTNSVSHSSN